MMAAACPAHTAGQVKRVRCESSGAMVPKDKAIKRFVVRNIVDASAIRDIQEASVFDGEARPRHGRHRSCTACAPEWGGWSRACCAIARPAAGAPAWLGPKAHSGTHRNDSRYVSGKHAVLTKLC